MSKHNPQTKNILISKEPSLDVLIPVSQESIGLGTTGHPKRYSICSVAALSSKKVRNQTLKCKPFRDFPAYCRPNSPKTS